MEKSSIRKVLNILFGHLWVVELTYKYCSHYLPPGLLILVVIFHHCQRHQRYRWQFFASVVDTRGKFAKGVVDNGSNFATFVIDTVGAPWLVNISANFYKKIKMNLMLFPGSWGNMIHEKNIKQKISWHCPKSGVRLQPPDSYIYTWDIWPQVYFACIIFLDISGLTNGWPWPRSWPWTASRDSGIQIPLLSMRKR